MNAGGREVPRLFHIHIPKTGGTSLNAMFSAVFGDAFQKHGLTREMPTPVRPMVAAHRTYWQARRLCPDHLFCCVVRDPYSRLQSNLEHVLARSGNENYAQKAALLRNLIDSGYSPSCEVFDDAVFLHNFDNLTVRFLAGTPVRGRVGERDLRSAMDNLGNINFLATLPTLEEDSRALFRALGVEPPPLPRKNASIATTPLFLEMPASLRAMASFDEMLYAEVLRRRRDRGAGP